MADWDADVVIVGGGGAGLAAAVEAAELGRRILLLEKDPHLGGTTLLAVGSITACCTPHQRRRGIQDSPEAFAEDIGAFNRLRGLDSRDNLEFRRLLAEESPKTLEWLVAQGVEFFGPMPEPPNRHPRMHNALPNASAYIHHLGRQARRRGVDIRLGVRAEGLLTEGGRVTGVEATTREGQRVRIGAARGVVLAAGDFSASREMKEAYLGHELANIAGINPACTGDGHRMALEVGAHLVNSDLLLGPEVRFVAPPRKTLLSQVPPVKPLAKAMNVVASRIPLRLLRPLILAFINSYLAPSLRLFEGGAILVNREGRRFVNERERPVLAIPHQPQGVAFILLDAQVARKFSRWPYYISTASGVAYAYLEDYRRNRRDIYAEAPSVAQLARRLRLPEETLAETVTDYNRSVDRGSDVAFGRPNPGPGLRVPPYYALGPAKSWVVVTDGGLAVSRRMEVLDLGGRPIPGLYAAGSTGQGGVLLEAHGLHLCWAFASGRIAGRQAATS